MTQSFFIGSKKGTNVLTIEGVGLTPHEARSQAIQIGRAMYKIPDPIALNPAVAAERLRHKYAAERMSNLNHSTPFWRQREDTRYH